MFSKTYRVGPSDSDQNLNAKISALFVYMQDVAMEHAEDLHIGKAATMDKGLIWVITRYSLSINRLPKYLEEITVSTYCGDNMKFIFPRYYEIKDNKGNILATASVTWMVLHKATHQVHFNPFNGLLLPTEHYEGEEPLPSKIQPLEASLIDNRRVRNSDVDINGHLNNTCYIEYLTDSHDYDFYQTRQIKHMVLEYKKEIKINQTVEIYSNKANPEYLELRVGGEPCFIALVEYR